MKKIISLCLVSLITLMGAGCYGSFSLTKKVYAYHGTIGDKWIRSVLMFVIGGPVYGVTTFADAVIFNAIEFWTGSNPVTQGNTLEQQDEAGNKLVATRIPGGALELTVIKTDGTVKTMTLTKTDDVVKAYDDQGKVIAQMAAPMEESLAQ